MAIGDANGDLAASFRAKAAFMKTWKPASPPSNRDRLELYALHRQVVSGDAPASFPSTANASEKAKYQAWKAKRGVTQSEAMSLYIHECDRQLRVYGTTPLTPQNTPIESSSSLEQQQEQQQHSPHATPRGLAAIPLLCAAASESRSAYLRRLENTQLESGWWSRQEPLCAPPGSLWSLPEALLLGLAALVERLSLTCFEGMLPLPKSTVQSFLWPVHNALLSLWMGAILLWTSLDAALMLGKTLLWGSRRTGVTMDSVWNDEIQLSSQSIASICEPHQPMSARLVGLALLPFTLVVGTSDMARGIAGIVLASALYNTILFTTAWYWLITLPWLSGLLLVAAFMSGWCFALIDAAGV